MAGTEDITPAETIRIDLDASIRGVAPELADRAGLRGFSLELQLMTAREASLTAFEWAARAEGIQGAYESGQSAPFREAYAYALGKLGLVVRRLTGPAGIDSTDQQVISTWLEGALEFATLQFVFQAYLEGARPDPAAAFLVANARHSGPGSASDSPGNAGD